MISRFFSKSKPIHSVIVAFIVALVFIAIKYSYLSSGLDTFQFFKQIFFGLLAVFSVFLLDFIVSKNALTKGSAFAILIFALLISLIPNGLANSRILAATIFVLFALRRIISLQSKINVKKKLFDATFWIVLAGLFYFWSILFLILVVLALFYYAQNDPKNWLIPFVAIITIAVLLMAYNILMYGSWYLESQLRTPQLSFNFTNYNSSKAIMSITLVFTILIWSSIYYTKKLQNTKGKSKPSYVFIGVAAITAVIAAIISPLKDGSEFLFLFAPLAIIMANYLEQLQDNKFKEVLIWILIGAPLIRLVL